jgi:hypothetical protein
MYKLHNGTDGMPCAASIVGSTTSFPFSPGNSDYAAYQAWLAEGNTPEPADKPTLAEIKTAKWEAIKAERERRTLSGGYQAGGKWFHSDLISRGQQLGLNVLNGSVPPGIMWKTMDGSFIEMTWALAQQILAAASQSDRAIFLAAEAHRAAMEASADPANYDFSGGWPPVYGE